jgi:hypothetical protein
MNTTAEISENLELEFTNNPRQLKIKAEFPENDSDFITLVYDIAGLLHEQMVTRQLCDYYDETSGNLRSIAEKRF